MRWPGFIGSPHGRINLYEGLEPPGGEDRMILYGTPGLALWADLVTSAPARALFWQDQRAFAVSGDGFFELFGPELFIRRGTLAVDTMPATISSNGLNGNQLFIVSGGLGYTFNIATNTFAQITDVDFLPSTTAANALMGGHLDGYFLVIVRNGTFQVSARNDGTNWGTDVGTRSQASDTFIALLVDPPHVWLWGRLTGEVWYNNGAPDFPFAPVPQGFQQAGIAAPFSAAPFVGGVVWLSATRAGQLQVVRGNVGRTTPQVISNPGVERALKSYARVDDAIAWTYQDEGHQFYVLTFPTAQATWVFDATVPAVSAWHQRDYWPGTGQSEAHLGRCHCFAYGAHLVGSRVDGKIYRMDLGLYDDAGTQIRRVRQLPRLSNENQRLFFRHQHLEVEVGTGPATIIHRWSDDDGNTWSSDHEASTGAVGAYRTRVDWGPLGSSRGRLAEFITTDPARVMWRDLYVDVEKGRS